MHIPLARCNPCREAYPTTSLCFIFSPSPDLPHPSGFKQDPLPDPKPRTSLHLSLPPPNGKNTGSTFSSLCLPSPSGMVSRFCDVVVRYRGVVEFHGVHQGTFVGPLSFLILLALFTCVYGRGCCCAWFNLM